MTVRILNLTDQYTLKNVVDKTPFCFEWLKFNVEFEYFNIGVYTVYASIFVRDKYYMYI